MKQYMDIMDEPKTDQEVYIRWMGRLRGEAIIAYGRKITVKFL